MTAWLACLALASLPAAPEAGRVDPAQFHRAVDELLADPEYRHLVRFRDGAHQEEPAPPPPREGRPQPAPGTKAGEAGPGWTPRWLLGLPDPSGLVASLRLVVYAALAAAVLWIAILMLRLLQRGADAEEPAAVPFGPVELPVSSPGEQAPDDCRRQASALARAGRYRDAIRLLLLGAMSAIDSRGLIRRRQGLTNADYLRAVRREPPLRRALETIVLAFDETHFGRREASAERFEDCLRHYQAGFHG